jgi:hypothetical protein
MLTAKLLVGAVFALGGLGLLVVMLLLHLTLWLTVPVIIALGTAYSLIDDT